MDYMKRFIECYVPVTTCNMKCQYCYVTQNGWWKEGLPDLSRAKQVIKEALNIGRLGGVCMINICGSGETLLPPEMPSIMKQILEAGHYLMVVTNGTARKRLEEITQFAPDLKQRLFLKISFHYLELKRLNILEEFFDNVKMIQKAGISFTVEITPDDGYIPYIQEIQKTCMDGLGALCHVTVTRDEATKGYPMLSKLSRDKFVEAWKGFDSELFRFKESIFGVKRKEFCYAGSWSICMDLGSGDYRQCYRGKLLGNMYKDLKKPLRFCSVGNNCMEGHCFNGHAFLAFGVIPELDAPVYSKLRNRVNKDEEEWIGEKMRNFMDCRLKDCNNEFGIWEKFISNIRSFQYLRVIKEWYYHR